MTSPLFEFASLALYIGTEVTCTESDSSRIIVRVSESLIRENAIRENCVASSWLLNVHETYIPTFVHTDFVLSFTSAYANE